MRSLVIISILSTVMFGCYSQNKFVESEQRFGAWVMPTHQIGDYIVYPRFECTKINDTFGSYYSLKGRIQVDIKVPKDGIDIDSKDDIQIESVCLKLNKYQTDTCIDLTKIAPTYEKAGYKQVKGARFAIDSLRLDSLSSIELTYDVFSHNDEMLYKYSYTDTLSPAQDVNGVVFVGEPSSPFCPMTTIAFDLQDTSNVILAVYNVYGECVDTVINEFLQPGHYDWEWDAEDIPSGIYFYKIETSYGSDTKKMVLMK